MRFAVHVVAGVGLIFAGCAKEVEMKSEEPVKQEQQAKVAPSDHFETIPNSELWFKGSLGDAFAKAKESKQQVFVYWGAVWCPPCNHLKKEVFAHPDFGHLMKPYLMVYLDGDDEEAQKWGEKFSFSGYPTIIFFNSDAKEISRIDIGVSFADFKRTAESVASSKDDLRQSIERGLVKLANSNDWKVIAYASWDDSAAFGVPDNKRILVLKKLLANAPKEAAKERAALASNLLVAASTIEGTKPFDVQSYLDLVFENEASEFTARNFILYYPKDFLDWEKPKNTAELKLKWLAAAERISKNPEASADHRTWMVAPQIAFAVYEVGGKAETLPKEFKDKVILHVQNQVAGLKTEYDRHAVISGAVYLLTQVKAFDEGRKILDEELKKTDTPWYYHSSYASLEKKAGNRAKSLEWSQKARTSVIGRASKVQWIVSDLQNIADAKLPGYEKAASKVLNDFYDSVFGLKDGFNGRNLSRMKAVQKTIKPIKSNPEIVAIVKNYQGRCSSLDGKSKETCAAHFTGI